MGTLDESVMVLAASVLAMALSFITVGRSYAELRRDRRKAADEHQPLDAKLATIIELSQRLDRMNQEVKAEFDLQLAATKQAKRDAENAAALAALSEEGRRAAADLVQAQISEAFDKTRKSERRFQIMLAVGSFVAGAAVTFLVSTLLG